MQTTIFTILIALVSAQSTGYPLATTVSNSPAGQTAVARFPFSGVRKNITGSVTFVSEQNGAVQISVDLQGLPSSGMPFIYHIHEYPVTGDNCTSTGAHLDPTKRGEVPICDAQVPASCQVGDLSGKHGNITSTSFMQTYEDPFLAFDPSSPSSFIGKSVTIHTFNKTRIACSNITLLSSTGSAGAAASNSTPASSASSSSAAAPVTAVSATQLPVAGSSASILQISSTLFCAVILALWC